MQGSDHADMNKTKTPVKELPSLLALDHLTLDSRLQCRDLKPSVVDDYAKAMRRGEAFPPVSVVWDGEENYYLVDGHHRVAATRKLSGVDSIAVQMIRGNFSLALWLSWGANRGHGLPRTREAKRRAVRAALGHPDWSGRSDRAIAKHVGCDHKTVAALHRILKHGEFPKDASTEKPNPVKKQVLQACGLLAGVQAMKLPSFDQDEMVEIKDACDYLGRLLSNRKSQSRKRSGTTQEAQ
jgi:hypothetical protein